MKLAKSLLLGSATAFVAVAGANAADLPSKKAAPVSYVKVCDAYGAGFFNIPGTDTCIKVGGRVRYDLGYAPTQNVFIAKTSSTSYSLNSSGTATANAKSSAGYRNTQVQDTWGQHARARVDLDARTPTAYGTVQSVVSFRVNQSSGVLGASQSPVAAIDTTYDASKYEKAGPSVEAAYIRFAGFTFGRAKEIFAQGHSLSFGANSHFPSFASGALQASYTALLGGGLSVQIGVEDPSDHGQQNLKTSEMPYSTPYDKMPLVAGNVRLEQGWGSVTASAAFVQNRSVKYADTSISNSAVSYDASKSAWATALFTTINLPMLGAGDKLWVMGGYSNGINSLGFKSASNDSSNNARDIGGIAQSYKNFTCDNGTPNVCQNTKSTWVSGALEHYWTPSIRQNLMAGWAKVDPGSIAIAAAASTQKAAFVSIGSNVIWSPTKNFDLGLEALYNRQNVTRGYNSATLGCTGTNFDAACKDSGHGMFYRFRAERTF